MGLKAIVDKVLSCTPLRSLRTRLNVKVDTKLNQFIQPLNEAIADTRHFQINTINMIHDANNRSIVQYRQLLENQAIAYYHVWLAHALPGFDQALAKIAGDHYPDVAAHAYLLLMDISKNYLGPGGLWQLDYEISLFNTPPPPPRPAPLPAKAKGGRLKILVASAMFPSIDHGGGLRLFDIISQLASEHEVDLLSVFVPEADQPSLELLRGSLGRIKLMAEVAMQPPTVLDWLADQGLTPGHYDVIQLEYPLSVRLIDALRPFGRKIGFTFMESVTKSFMIKLRNAINDKKFSEIGEMAQGCWEFAVKELLGARNTDFQIAMTPEDAQFIEAVSGIRPAIIPTCLSPSQVLSRIEACREVAPEPETVVFLGYFNHFPNIDGMIWYLRQVHPEVKRQVPGYRFLVVGAGDTSPLQAISQGDDSVIYTGRVDDITPFIMRGQVCVLPLISGAGIRGKLNQYSIAGRPSVSTTIGNLGIDLPDGEAVLIADTPQAFAQAVVRLLTDDSLNRSVAARAQAHAREHFTWERHLARLVEIYRQ